VVYLSLCRQISGQYLNYTTTGLFQIVTHLPTLRYTARDTESDLSSEIQHICFNIRIRKFMKEAQLKEKSLQMFSYRYLFQLIFKNTSFVVIFTFPYGKLNLEQKCTSPSGVHANY
jgi:hypothetical protein